MTIYYVLLYDYKVVLGDVTNSNTAYQQRHIKLLNLSKNMSLMSVNSFKN